MSPEELQESRKGAGKRDYEKHKAERLKKASAYYLATKEERKITQRAWRAANQDRQRELNRKRREKRGDELRAARRQHYRDNKVSYVANARKREMGKLNATPPWADLKAIEVFYQRAADLTERTGIKHHVDHIYPLRSKVMCGLHVEANLQIIPAIVNLRKSNAVGIPATPLCCAWPFVIDTGEIGSASYFARGSGEHRRRAG